MKLNISHPEKQSLQFVSRAFESGEVIYRSPHVGNVNGSELGLVLGLSAMDASMQLELVDTIRGNDSYSQPRVAIVGLEKIVLASNKHSGRVVGSCQSKTEGIQQLESIGIAVPESTTTLKQLHVDSLRQVLPDNVEVTPSTEFFGQLSDNVYKTILKEAAAILGRPLRSVQDTGKIEQTVEPADFSNVYGLGSNPNEGLLPPLEAMMAIEIVKKVLESESEDNQIVHIAGVDMIRYTKNPSIMQPVEEIVARVLSDLGMSNNLCFDYVVPCMKEVLESDEFDTTIGEDVQSQYDILVAKQFAGDTL